jgi:Asp-tRNA(Asn)/Glu-tRNA(Gln) amidotransferase A subunit family amidase
MIQEYTVSAEFDFMTASELRRLVAAREISPVELTERAEATQDRLNAFFVLMPEKLGLPVRTRSKLKQGPGSEHRDGPEAREEAEIF